MSTTMSISKQPMKDDDCLKNGEIDRVEPEDFVMEKTKWLWKRKFSDRSPETDSSGSFSSQSGRLTDELDSSKDSSSHSVHSPEVTSKINGKPEEVNETVKALTEKLSEALINVSSKDDLVKQHSKVAEEAVAGWEKAENEVLALKKQISASLNQKLALEERVSHLDGALKECVRQLRLAREEQEEKIHESVAKKIQHFDSVKLELENQLIEAKVKADSLAAVPPKIDQDSMNKIEFLEEENTSLRIELHSLSEELELRTIERDLSTHAAETASKQHLESIKKVAKLESECRGLRFMLAKISTSSDTKASSFPFDSSKLAVSRFSDASMAEKSRRNSAIDIELMDDFIEMEKLASLPDQTEVENSSRNKIDIMANRISELDEDLHHMESKKIELEKQLMKCEADKAELELVLSKASESNETSKILLSEAEEEIKQLHGKLESATELKMVAESKLVKIEEEARDLSQRVNTLEAEAQIMSEKITSLVTEVESEKAASIEMAVKYEQLHEEHLKTIQEAETRQTLKSNTAAKIKQEDLAMAAGKLAECQKTIFSLGNQLKSLSTLEDFFIDSSELTEKAVAVPTRFSSEVSFLSNNYDNSTSQSSSPSSVLLANHVSSDKNRNGFAKFFSRSKNGIHLEI